MKSIRQRRFQAIEIVVLSIWKNFDHQSGIDVEEKILFRVESYVFAGKEFESKWRLYKFPWLEPICFSEYLKQFLELWNALKPFRMWKHFRNPLEMVQILFENRFENVKGKIFSQLVCVHYPHAGECAIALHVIIFFLQKSQVFQRIWNYAFHFSCLLVAKLLCLKMENLSDLLGFALTINYTLWEGAKGG